MPGGVTNYQMTENAKVRQMVRHLVDLTTANLVYMGEFPETDIAIKAVRCRIENATTAGALQLDLGHGLPAAIDIDSIVDVGVIATGAIEGAETEFTLASTLKNTNVKEAHGFPIVPKGDPIYATIDGVPTTGAGTITIEYFPLDEKNY